MAIIDLYHPIGQNRSFEDVRSLHIIQFQVNILTPLPQVQFVDEGASVANLPIDIEGEQFKSISYYFGN